jgi:hypothetical protein
MNRDGMHQVRPTGRTRGGWRIRLKNSAAGLRSAISRAIVDGSAEHSGRNKASAVGNREESEKKSLRVDRGSKPGIEFEALLNKPSSSFQAETTAKANR